MWEKGETLFVGDGQSGGAWGGPGPGGGPGGKRAGGVSVGPVGEGEVRSGEEGAGGTAGRLPLLRQHRRHEPEQRRTAMPLRTTTTWATRAQMTPRPTKRRWVAIVRTLARC